MTNLTISVDDDVLRSARIRALEQGTSVNAILRDYLDAYSSAREVHVHVIESLVNLAAATDSGGGTGRWSRDELHER